MRFFTGRSFRRFLAEAGLEVRGSRVTPGIARPFVPLIKRVYGQGSETLRQSDSSSIMDSASYRSYMRWLYPLERAICGVWPGLLAFQFVVLARPTSPAGLHNEAADHLYSDLAALEPY